MRNQVILALSFAALAGCDKPESAENLQSDNAAVSPTEGATDAAQDAVAAASDICAGFRTRENEARTLRGIAIGDSVAKVTKQLTCMTNSYEIDVSRNGGLANGVVELPNGERAVTSISGESIGPLGKQSLRVDFVGLPGSEKAYAVETSGYFSEGSMPSVEQFASSILRQHPEAKRYAAGVDGEMRNRTTIGYGRAVDGTKFTALNQLDHCARMGIVRDQCGFTYRAQLEFRLDNSLVPRFWAYMTDYAFAVPLINATASELVALRAQSNQEQLQAAEQRGGPSGL